MTEQANGEGKGRGGAKEGCRGKIGPEQLGHCSGNTRCHLLFRIQNVSALFPFCDGVLCLGRRTVTAGNAGVVLELSADGVGMMGHFFQWALPLSPIINISDAYFIELTL